MLEVELLAETAATQSAGESVVPLVKPLELQHPNRRNNLKMVLESQGKTPRPV